MTVQRHDFTQDTIRKLSDRVGSTCSNPECQAPTKGPHSDGDKAISIGMACHIWDSPERAIEDAATEIYGNFCKMGEGYEALTHLASTPLPSPI